MANGWRRTIPAVLSPILSDVPIVGVVLVALTQVPALFVHALQILGGLFLIYLAARAMADCRRYQQVSRASISPAHQTLLTAALVNLLNPNPYLAWALVLGPLLLKAWSESPVNGIALVVAFYLTMVLATAAVVMLLAAARSLGQRVARVLLGVSAVALGLFGAYQLWSGTTAIVQRIQPLW
jgi:threonine/homoserine/homoserine lactone efflux protein